MTNLPTVADVWKVAPLVVLLATSLFPITIKVLNKNREQGHIVTMFQAIVGIGVAIFFVLQAPLNTTAFAEAVVIDGLAYWSNLIILVLAGAVLFLSQGNISTRSEQFSEHVFLILSSCMGMLVLSWANDLIVTFIGIELMSLAFYVLVGLSIEQKLSKEAAFKYFILGSFGSAILLYGIAFIYGAVGSTSITEITKVGADLALQDPLFLLGIGLFLVGIFFKISIFPFHAWTPDVYQGAPTPVTAFMATAGKLIGFTVLLRFVGTGVLVNSVAMIDVMQWLAVLTMLVGNIAALRQESLKRVFAYSSIAHSGYAMTGVIAVASGGASDLGISGVLFYFLAYGLMNLGAFAIISLFEKNEQVIVGVNDLKGFAKTHPMMAAALTICLLSLAGIPPTIGFFGKFYVFSAALKQGFVWLAVWGVINSVISVYYYLRPVLNMYMHEAEQGVDMPNRDFFARLTLVWSSVVIILAGILAEPIISKMATAIRENFQ